MKALSDAAVQTRGGNERRGGSKIKSQVWISMEGWREKRKGAKSWNGVNNVHERQRMSG